MNHTPSLVARNDTAAMGSKNDWQSNVSHNRLEGHPVMSENSAP